MNEYIKSIFLIDISNKLMLANCQEMVILVRAPRF